MENCTFVTRNYDYASRFSFRVLVAGDEDPFEFCADDIDQPGVDEGFYHCLSQYSHSELSDLCDLPLDTVQSDEFGGALICKNVFMGVLGAVRYLKPCTLPTVTYGRFTSLDYHKKWLQMIINRKSLKIAQKARNQLVYKAGVVQDLKDSLRDSRESSNSSEVESTNFNPKI